MASALSPRANEGYGVLVDLDKCIGCRACEVACKEWNNLKPVKTTFSPTFTNPPNFTAQDWKVVFYYEGVTTKELTTPTGKVTLKQVERVSVPAQCMHCVDPPCVRACPVNAISITPEGAVVINKDYCIGCGRCEEACPFHVPKRGNDGKFYKCTFCVDRIQHGMEPACVEACPTKAMTFGPITQIVQLAKEAVSEGKVVYGLIQSPYIGGQTRWIYASSKEKAFAIQQQFPKVAEVPEEVLREGLKIAAEVAAPVAAAGLLIVGLLSWRKSRMESKATNGGQKVNPGSNGRTQKLKNENNVNSSGKGDV